MAQLESELNDMNAHNMVVGEKLVDTLTTEFAISNISIRGKDRLSAYLRSKKTYVQRSFYISADKLNNIYLPSYAHATRLDTIMDTVIKCSWSALTGSQYAHIKSYCSKLMQLTTQEIRLFDTVYQLYRVQLFVLAVKKRKKDNELSQRLACYLFDYVNNLEHLEYVDSNEYNYQCGSSGQLNYVVDCMGNSSEFYGNKPTFLPTAQLNRNGVSVDVRDNRVMPPYSQHKYDQSTYMFKRQAYGLTDTLKLRYVDNSVIRRYTITNSYHKSRKLSIDINYTPYSLGRCICQHLSINGSDIIEYTNDSIRMFCCITVLIGEKVVQPAYLLDDNGACCRLTLSCQLSIAKLRTQRVTVIINYAQSIEQITQHINQNKCLDYLRDKAIFPTPIQPYCSTQLREYCAQYLSDAVIPSLHQLTRTYRYYHARRLPLLHYDKCTYIMGGVDSAVDSEGNMATLNEGYITKLGGEKVYLINGNCAVDMTMGDLSVDSKRIIYTYKQNNIEAQLTVQNNQSKSYTVTTNGQEVIILYCYHFTTKVQFCYANNTFFCLDTGCQIKVDNVINYSSNILEFDDYTFMLSLSNNLYSSCFLAFTVKAQPNDSSCSGSSASVVELSVNTPTYPSHKVIDDCQLATSLNYYSNLNLFLCRHHLTPCDAYMLASTVYTNPTYLRSQLHSMAQNAYCDNYALPYIDNIGLTKYSLDNYRFALSVIYYTNVTGDTDIIEQPDTLAVVRRQLLAEVDEHGNKMTQLLCLKKSFNLFDDNAELVCKYQHLVDKLTDEEYEYAQLIGAVSCRLDSQHLLDLYNKYSHLIDKVWLYVSMLENVYGVRMEKGLITIKPNTKLYLQPLHFSTHSKSLNVQFLPSANRSTQIGNATVITPIGVCALPRKHNYATVYH
ncbi:MAG: hypothetical protein PHW00_02825 [Clostridia bacterium]|nr:hypothetical protein [Clostridia bacterium]